MVDHGPSVRLVGKGSGRLRAHAVLGMSMFLPATLTLGKATIVEIFCHEIRHLMSGKRTGAICRVEKIEGWQGIQDWYEDCTAIRSLTMCRQILSRRIKGGSDES